MKTIFRNLGLGILMAGCVAVTGSQAFAQDTTAAADPCKDIEGQQALYKAFTDNIPKNPTLDQTNAAIKAGDDYVQKYGACPESKQIVDYLNQYLPGMKKGVEAKTKGAANDALITRFDTAAKAKNVPEIFASGKEILGKEADFPKVALDVMLTLVSAGYDQTRLATPVDTYNADTINYAKAAIQKIESGATSTGWGVYTYNFNNGKFKDTKAYTLGALSYIIGDITSSRLGKTDAAKRKEALPYFYKASQYDSFAKNDPFVYQSAGAWYLDEAIRIDKERQAILAAMPEKERKDNEKTLAMVGEQKGYADRAIDAYSRAYNLTKANTKTPKATVDNLYTRLKELYAFRFDNKTEGMDAAIAKADATPFPDPSTPITPVTVEPTEPATTPTGTGTTPATTGTTTPATGTTKPATGTTTAPTTTPKPVTTPKPATTPTGTAKPAGTATTDSATDNKNAVKKTTPKKKGTR